MKLKTLLMPLGEIEPGRPTVQDRIINGGALAGLLGMAGSIIGVAYDIVDIAFLAETTFDKMDSASEAMMLCAGGGTSSVIYLAASAIQSGRRAR